MPKGLLVAARVPVRVFENWVAKKALIALPEALLPSTGHNYIGHNYIGHNSSRVRAINVGLLNIMWQRKVTRFDKSVLRSVPKFPNSMS